MSVIQCECGACVKSIYYHLRSKKHQLYVLTGIKHKPKDRVNRNKKYYDRRVRPMRVYDSSIQCISLLFI